MHTLVGLLVLVTYAFGSPLVNDERIVNGTGAKPGEIPYIVSLRNLDAHVCAGSILGPFHVLTAAHCISNESMAWMMSIQYGMTEKTKERIQVIPVTRVFVHEGYHFGNGYPNDVAILTLQNGLPYSKFVQPVVLPEQDEPTPVHDYSVLAGWGYSNSEGPQHKNLQRVDLLIESIEDCQKAFSVIDPTYHVCTTMEGGIGQCDYDSGGPLASGGKQIGIVSWSTKLPCVQKGYPSVYTRVASYVDWIKAHMLF